MHTLVVDNGGSSLKIIRNGNTVPSVFPNCVYKSKVDRKRVYVSDEITELNDHSSLYLSMPCERGYLVNWDVECQVWERVLTRWEDPSDTALALSDPIYTVPALSDQSAEVIFEELGFAALHKSSTASWIGQREFLSHKRLTLLIDCGFSFTHIVPLLDGKIIQKGVIRIDVSGKSLTNLLKEWISYRQLQVMEETYIINECKEDACFVSLDFDKDLTDSRLPGAQNSIIKEYVLPDFCTHTRGVLRDISKEKCDAQTLILNHERFALPEALFRPHELGLDQMGIGEAVGECIRRMDENLRGALLKNVVVVGGSTLFPNFIPRLIAEIQSNVNCNYEVKVVQVNDPITHACSCGAELADQNKLFGGFVKKSEWDDCGPDFLEERFFCFLTDDEYEKELQENKEEDAIQDG